MSFLGKKYKESEKPPSNKLLEIGGLYNCTAGLSANGGMTALTESVFKKLVAIATPRRYTTVRGVKNLPLTMTVKAVVTGRTTGAAVSRARMIGLGLAKVCIAAIGCIKP